ncbi:hypothetical protein FWD07_02980 [Candidatus Saccharibacteria bacterium]|nr:hypothetical protein [Candidatus Saccharibacteria bacterium]
MMSVRKNPTQTKKQILKFLKNRGGVLRSGQVEVWQVIYGKIFRKGWARSHHQNIMALEEYILALEDTGQVVLRRNPGGLCNYIALSDADDSQLQTGGELQPSELEELFANMSSDYYRMEKELEQAQDDADAALRLASEHEQAKNTAESDRDAALKARDHSLEELRKIQESTEHTRVAVIVDDLGGQLAAAQASDRKAQLAIITKDGEITTLTTKLDDIKTQLSDQKETNGRLQDKLKTAISARKADNKTAAETIKRLESERDKALSGDGLTAPKAIASALYAIDGVLDQMRVILLEDLADCCIKYVPTDKQDKFRAEIAAAHKKMSRRK